MWGFLSEKERGLVLQPKSHPKLANASYPISIGQLATLTGATENQLRHWHELGLLRARRTRGGHRKFFANAALRAFFLHSQMPQSYITVLRDVQSFKGGSFLAGLATILQEQADDFDPSDRDLLAHLADDLKRLSLVFARRSGTLSASSFQHISSDDWASLDETPKTARRATASHRVSAR
jgi:DNA-binding transcriptional MerR regulator